MATKTQTTTDSNSSTEQSGWSRRVLHRLNNSPVLEVWAGLILMYADVAAVTLLNSWNLAWAEPIGVVLVILGATEIVAKKVYNGEL